MTSRERAKKRRAILADVGSDIAGVLEKSAKRFRRASKSESPGRQEEGLMSLTDAVRPTTPKRDADAVGEDGWPTSAPSVVNLVGKPKTRPNAGGGGQQPCRPGYVAPLCWLLERFQLLVAP